MASQPFPAILAVALLAVACSSAADHSGSRPRGDPSGAGPAGDAGSHSPGDDPGKSNVSSAEKKNVCATLDYGHVRPNDDYYLQFADDSTALDYSKAFLAANGMPAPSDVSHDERLTRLVAQVYGGYRKVFPRETTGLDTPPRIVVVSGQGLNAFAGFDDRPEVNKAPWLFYVYSQVLQYPATVELTGLFSHELAHLILRNLLPETRARIRTHYRVPGGVEQGVIGAVAVDDPVIRARTEEIRDIGAEVGRHSIMGPMPLSPFLLTQYNSMLDTLKAARDQSAPDACRASDDGLQKMAAIYTPAGGSIHDYVLHLTAAQNADLAKLSLSTADSMKKCYANAKGSLFELKVRDKVSKKPANEAAAILQTMLDPTTAEYKAAQEELMTNDVERKADAENGTPTIERLLGVVDTLHRRLAELESDTSLPLDELRVFDLEEDADDSAVRILKAIGQDQLANGRIYVNMMPDPAACFSEVESGKVPAYGRFIDPHNNTCWRYYHTVQLVNALAQCPAEPAQATNPPSAAPPISPADLSPSRLLERRALTNH